MKNLYYIESPFQLMSAYESIKYLKLTSYKILIRLNGNKNNENQMKYILSDLNMINFLFIRINKKKSFLDYINIMKLFSYKLFHLISLKSLYLGDFNSIVSQIMFKFNIDYFTKIYLLDDGVSTITIYNEITNLKLNLFTIFNLENKGKIKVIQHDFFYLKKNIFVESEIKRNIFIGTQFVKSGFINEEVYLCCIKKSVDIVNENILYFPHRNESQELINKISSLSRIEVVYSELPIEYYLMQSNYNPDKIFTLFSTALISLNILFNDIEIIVMQPEFNEHKEKKDLLKQYDFLAEINDLKFELLKIK